MLYNQSIKIRRLVTFWVGEREREMKRIKRKTRQGSQMGETWEMRIKWEKNKRGALFIWIWTSKSAVGCQIKRLN